MANIQISIVSFLFQERFLAICWFYTSWCRVWLVTTSDSWRVTVNGQIAEWLFPDKNSLCSRLLCIFYIAILSLRKIMANFNSTNGACLGRFCYLSPVISTQSRAQHKLSVMLRFIYAELQSFTCCLRHSAACTCSCNLCCCVFVHIHICNQLLFYNTIRCASW